jgi:energy-coupling factor transporter ATP-binding protein EcfA2
MMQLTEATLERVLRRVDAVWGPDAAPHHLVYGQTGSGKTTLIKALLGLCPHSRVLVLEPKRNADPAYLGPAEDPHRWGKPVERVTPRFGFEGERGGGRAGMWFRIQGSPNREDTARRFSDALDIVANEGHAVLVLDDTKEICKQLKLNDQIESLLNLGRSAAVLAILATTETSYVAGRSQGSMVWVGYTGGNLPAAKAGAELLGWRGRERQDYTAALPRHSWVFSENEPGSAGPVLVTPLGIRADADTRESTPCATVQRPCRRAISSWTRRASSGLYGFGAETWSQRPSMVPAPCRRTSTT